MRHLPFLVIPFTSRSSKLKENAVPLKLRRPPKAPVCCSWFLFILSSCSLRRKSGFCVLGITQRPVLLNKHSGSPFNLLGVLHMLGTKVGCTLPAFSRFFIPCKTQVHGLLVDMAVLGLRLDLMTFKVFSNLNDSMTLCVFTLKMQTKP